MANINKIRLSGTTYSIQDENATKTVELTQSEYDALSPKDPNTFYIITDAKGADLSNYYTKSETSGATEISTALASKADTATTYTKTETDNAITAATSTKQDTLVSGTNIKTINGETLLGEGNIAIQGGGGGKAIEAGRGISITTGETADTVSFNLPISAGTRAAALIYNSTANEARGYYSNAEGNYTTAGGDYSHAEGYIAFAEGYASHAEGLSTRAEGYASHAEGKFTRTTNESEHSSGGYNNSVSASTTFGNSGNTLFSVGNGTSESERHNAFEIRQNGDIYIADTNDTSTTNYYEKPMIKLQDALGGGGGSSYTAGDGIDINNDVISVTGKVDTSTYETYTAATDTALASKQTTLTAGTGISIVDNVISSTGGGGSITIDPSLDSGSTNPVANSAITNTLYSAANANGDGNGYVGNIEAKEDSTYLDRLIWGFSATRYKRSLGGYNSNNTQGISFYCSSINGVRTVSKNYQNVGHFSLVETSAITTSVTSSSTDAQVPSAKAVYDIVGNIETLLSKI